MARRKEAHGGGHGWFVTFADLMGLLVSFFVMLVAFSNQDAKKVQAVAGSMRDAFGVQNVVRNSGLVESEGLQTRDKLKNTAHIRPEDSSITPTPNERGSSFESDQAFALSAASLRQALQNMPELAEASKHIMIEEHMEGLNIEIVDQDGSSMFPEGSREPYERTRKLIQKIAGPLKDTPYRISITGHTSASKTPPPASYGPWNLSVDRANTVRQILEEEGYPSANIYKVAGKADTDPLFPEDRSMAPNRRVTITLIREAPPVPAGLQP
jgi:chemotaxis protein MotB